MTHIICVSKLAIIGSDNGLSPGERQAVNWTNAGILLIRTLGTNFSEILIEIHTFSLKNALKMSSAKWRQFVLCLNVLMAFVKRIDGLPVDSPHKGPFMGKLPVRRIRRTEVQRCKDLFQY